MWWIVIALTISALVAYLLFWLRTTWAAMRVITTQGNLYHYMGENIPRSFDLAGAQQRFNSYPFSLCAMLVLLEDMEFFKHSGFNLKEITRCVKLLVTGKEIRGGSSITQQLSKRLFTNGRPTIYRKIKETLGAIYLERHFSKLDIMALYLDQIRFWPNSIYGVTQASEKLFRRSVSSLTLGQSTFLVFLLSGPQTRLQAFPTNSLQYRNKRSLYYRLHLFLAYATYHRLPRFLAPEDIPRTINRIVQFEMRLLSKETDKIVTADSLFALREISFESLRNTEPFKDDALDTVATPAQMEVINAIRSHIKGLRPLKLLSTEALQFATQLGVLHLAQAETTSSSTEFWQNSLKVADTDNEFPRALELSALCATSRWSDLRALYSFCCHVLLWTDEKMSTFFEHAKQQQKEEVCGYTIALSNAIFQTSAPGNFLAMFYQSRERIESYQNYLTGIFFQDTAKATRHVG